MNNIPSDEELRQLAEERGIGWAAGLGGMDGFLRAFSSGVLAKWGAPQQGVLESSEDLYWKLHGLSKILEGSGLIDESRSPDAYTTILDAMAFVRGAQPVVLEPLTPSQYNIALGCATDIPPSRYEVVTRAIERAHGITQKGSNAE